MLRLAVRVDRGHADRVLAELLELAPSGVEEVDVDDATVEFAVYGAPGELPELPALHAAAGEGGTTLVAVSTREIEDDWADRWREFHRPLVVHDAAGRPRLTVRPPWEPASAAGEDIVIDPGRAFGTGAHATTALCLELLLDLADAPTSPDAPTAPGARGRCVDLGCGSGVLAILAARLGWAPVLGLDFDPLAVAATRENAARNRVTLTAERFDLRTDQVPYAALVVANVLAGPLLQWAERQERMPARLILSGLLAEETERVAAAYAERGLTVGERRVRGEWAALCLHRDPVAAGPIGRPA